MYIEVKELPETVQNILKSIGYGRKDIPVNIRETFTLAGVSGQGSRAFTILLNASTGESKRFIGSWGGPNMFNPTNPVDLDTTVRPIPVDGMVISGSEGNSVYASISVHPQNVNGKFLPPVDTSLSDRDRSIIYCYSHIRSGGIYRKEALSKINPTAEEFASLISRGYLTENKVGKSVTTKGRNVNMTGIKVY